MRIMSVLVLGGGWVGSRFCFRDPSIYITTARSVEKVAELTTTLGIKAIQFDLQKEETWSNLPLKSEIEATVITFALSDTHFSHLNRLWETHLATDKPIISLGTSSCFQSGGYDSIVDETALLTGKSVAGLPLTDRVQGEEWVLARGGAILHLSGIFGDDEVNNGSCGYGPPRYIKTFLSKGYYKNGFALLNCIHITDICKIVDILIEKFKNDPALVCGQRILASCGAFRVQHLLRALSMDLLPEILPPHSTMERSKILSTAKLHAFLPHNYEWIWPIAGVEPVSQGLPTTGPLPQSSAAIQRQWELAKSEFCGKWQGTTTRYEKDKGRKCGGKLDHSKYIAEMKAEILPAPVSIDQWNCHVSVLDSDTLAWHGTGNRFPQGEKFLTFSKKCIYNPKSTFCFKGLTGRWGFESFNASDIFFAEVNFYYKGSRSMIITRYALDSTSGRYLLHSVSITPFRCELHCDFPRKPPQDQCRGSVNQLVQLLQGRTCRRQWWNYTHALDEADGGELCKYPTKSVQLFSDPDRVVQLFDDDIVCSIPPDFSTASAYDLAFGCFHTPNYAQIVTIAYEPNGKIKEYALEKW